MRRFAAIALVWAASGCTGSMNSPRTAYVIGKPSLSSSAADRVESRTKRYLAWDTTTNECLVLDIGQSVEVIESDRKWATVKVVGGRRDGRTVQTDRKNVMSWDDWRKIIDSPPSP